MADPLDMDDTQAMRVLELLRNIALRRHSEALKDGIDAERRAREAVEQIAALDRALSALLGRLRNA